MSIRTSRGFRAAAAWIVAASLVCTCVGTAAAGPASEEAEVQRPTAPPKLPEPAETEPTEPESAEPQPAESEPESEPAEPEPDQAEAEGLPVVEGRPPVTAYAPDFDEPGGDQALIDAAWEGVDGFEVELELVGGKTMTGRVGAVQRDTFTLIEAETGQVRVLPKSGVDSLRVRVPPAVPSKNGTGLMTGGGVLTTLSLPVFISGMVFLGVCPDCVELHLPMLFVGGGGLAGGISMIVAGRRRHDAFLKAVREQSVTPVVARTRHGWSAGVRLRF